MDDGQNSETKQSQKEQETKIFKAEQDKDGDGKLNPVRYHCTSIRV